MPDQQEGEPVLPASSIRHVVAIGAIHNDTLAHAHEAIRPETSTPARMAAKPGGVATNIARVLVRLGVETTLVGAVGDDVAAAALETSLKADGLTLEWARRPGHATGQYLALHDPDGTLKAACVDDRVLAEAPAHTFDDCVARLRTSLPADTIWFLDANIPEPVLGRITASLPDGSIIANAVSNAKAVRLKPFLTKLQCLTLNRGEAASLLGLKLTSETKDLCEALRETGLNSFVLTDAGNDLKVLESGQIHTFSPSSSSIVDVTGAGDALTAGLVAALARGHTLLQAVPAGLAAAAMTLGSTGALADSLTWAALNRSGQ